MSWPTSVPDDDEPALRRRLAERIARHPDLESYLAYGLHASGALRAAYERWRMAIERIPQARALPDPMFSFVQFVESIETRTGPQERRYSLSQTFPWFGKRALRAALAGGRAEELWQQVVRARLDVERRIEVAFFEYGYLAQAIRIERDVLRLLKQLEPVVQRRIAAGSAGQDDLLRLQVEIGRVENEVASLEQVRPAMSARLTAAMNLSGHALLPLPELDEPDLSVTFRDAEALAARAEGLNPELLELVESIRTNRGALELAERERWPDVTLGVDYFETGSAVMPTPGSGDDPVALRLMFNLPIWNGKYAAAEREARHGIEESTHALADRRARLRSELERAVFELDDAARQVLLYRDSLLPRARESLTVTRTSYTSGDATLLDLIDTQRTLLEFETAYWRACRDHYQSRARLRALVGGEP